MGRVVVIPTWEGTDAIALKVKQEFAAKEKTKKAGKPMPPTADKTKKAA